MNKSTDVVNRENFSLAPMTRGHVNKYVCARARATRTHGNRAAHAVVVKYTAESIDRPTVVIRARRRRLQHVVYNTPPTTTIRAIVHRRPTTRMAFFSVYTRNGLYDRHDGVGWGREAVTLPPPRRIRRRPTQVTFSSLSRESPSRPNLYAIYFYNHAAQTTAVVVAAPRRRYAYCSWTKIKKHT